MPTKKKKKSALAGNYLGFKLDRNVKSSASKRKNVKATVKPKDVRTVTS